ncbi:MAG: site-specific DNA-methyltransferase [Candidatus Delongbacteria bacterium]|nr:site-specific DNA-methyltransferase [Candidatus Delongbacteria bacterium]MBN2795853.1 site-specific DNA-methyltransferase [Clostridia bacterium]
MLEQFNDEHFEKVNTKSLDINEERIEKLKQLFPNIVSDGKIDWKTLKQVLGENVVNENEERYQFSWSGKSKAIREASITSSNTLRPDKESSKNWDSTENLYIEGDNLEVLKILQNSYNNKIKMIYIDPPYNTGNDFVYKDDFTITAEEAEKLEGLRDDKGILQTADRLKKNEKNSAKYHTNWLNMMYPRLTLARDLLTDDGVIFISIDDNEVHNLRKICDEIFGESNFVAEALWKRRASSAMADNNVSADHEYVLIYQRGHFDGFIGIEKNFSNYKNPDNDPRGPWVLGDLTVGMTASMRPNQAYDLVDPITGNIYEHNPNRVWAYIPESMNKLIEEGRVVFPENKKNRPMLKRFKNSLKSTHNPFSTLMLDKVGLNSEATRQIQQILGGNIFDYSKPLSLLKTLIPQVCNDSDIILDFFSGSSVTAHAVMQLNAEDASTGSAQVGNRKYIMVQLPEPTDEKSEAYKAGYKNICEIGKERIRRAGEQIVNDQLSMVNDKKQKADLFGNDDSQLTTNHSKLDIGFKVFKLDSSNFVEWDDSYENLQESVEAGAKGAFTTYKTERTNLDLVYEIMLKEGLKLIDSVEEVKVNGKTIYKIADGVSYIYLDEINDNIIAKIIEMKNEVLEQFGLDNPTIVLDENYLDTETKSNMKKNFETNGIVNIKTI